MLTVPLPAMLGPRSAGPRQPQDGTRRTQALSAGGSRSLAGQTTPGTMQQHDAAVAHDPDQKQQDDQHSPNVDIRLGVSHGTAPQPAAVRML